MISEDYCNNEIEPLSPQQSVGEAIEKMNRMHLDMLPVVNQNQLVNYVSVHDLDHMDKEMKLSEMPMFALVLPFVKINQHLLNALTHLKSLDLSLMAVLDDAGTYHGILETKDVVKALSQSLSIRASGSIIVIRVKPIDYSLSDLSRIIEYSDAKILGCFVFEVENSDELEIHLKINTTALKHILATLERYDYKVVQYFNREDLTDDMDQRFENLMKFIDI